MLVIEGRMPTRSYGTTIETCTDILMRHKAYQALNLDGGTSAVLWYDGEYVTKCSNTSITSRMLPNAWLYGVTGSGKTVVYLRLIDDCLAAGRGAIVLVPEIALTPQLLRQFSVRYGARVAVLHSALRISERYEMWKRIRSGDADVVLGTRSAVFAPVRDLGLLIVDEEQEHTYQSENAPRYHAREVAIYRGAQEHALTVLGSATPTVESMYRAVTGAFGLCRITERYNGRPLPPVEIVDMKRELREGNASIISEPLLLALRENLRLGQQSILYLNRRGTSRMLACVECGSVPMCPGCSLPLTYHHANGRLMCHICGHSEPVPARCPVCGGHLRQIGCGTQRVEEQLQNLLPGVGASCTRATAS